MNIPASKLVTHICVLYVFTFCLTVALVAITFFGSMKLDSLRRDLDKKLSTKQLSRKFLRCLLEYDGTKLDREPLLTKELSGEDKSHEGESGLLDLVTNSEEHEGRKKWGHILVEKTARLRREISMNNTNDTNEEPNELNWLASFSKNLMKDMKTYCQESRLYCAAQGKPGPKGEKGDLGSKGNDGSNGMDGPPGPTGITGPKGDKGNHGDKGERGDHGNKGERGDHGDKGERGDHGDKGERGDRGDKGERGDHGDKGEEGEYGIPGLPGMKGEPGNPGFDGDIGMKGEIGDKGAKGEIGDRGEPGPTGSDGHPGNEGKPGLNGTDGQPGSVGPQGEKGERGDKGEKGEFGDKGERGPEGPPGLPGLAGPSGFPGVKGIPGEPGLPGAKGMSGNEGQRGLPGLDGSPGPKGDKGDAMCPYTTPWSASTAITTLDLSLPPRKHEDSTSETTPPPGSTAKTTVSFGLPTRKHVCSIQNIDHPITVKSYTAKHGAWFTNFPLSNDDRLWATFDTEGEYLYEFADVKALLANSTTTVYDLRSMNFYGTGQIIFNNSFYYHRSDSWDIVRYDLRLQSAVKLESLHPEAQFFGSERLYHNTPGIVDFAADETGLWVIYANHNDHANQTDDDPDDVFFLASLDPETLQIGKKFTIKHPRSERGNSFLVCGVLYVLPDTVSKRTNIQFSFDPFTEEVSDGIRLPFSNAHSDTAQLTYNPIKKELLSWDSGALVVLPVKLATFV